MITDAFESRTLANMEAALSDWQRKTSGSPIIAGKIIECANRGDATLSSLTEGGYAAAMQLVASGQSARK